MTKQKNYFNVENDCLYCDEEKNKSEHFTCNGCGTGMCEDCYSQDKEHDEHCFDFHESVEDEKLYNHIKECVGVDYGYMCYECINRFEQQLTNSN